MQATALKQEQQVELKTATECFGFACVPRESIGVGKPGIFGLYLDCLSKSYWAGGVITISPKQIMSELGVGRAQLAVNIKSLVKQGFITKDDSGKNRYRVYVPKGEFVKVPTVLLYDREISWGELRVYVAILSFKNEEMEYSFPFIETIARRLNLKERIVRRHIKRLVFLELIRIEQEPISDGYMRNKYFFSSLDDKYCEPGKPWKFKKEFQKHLDSVLGAQTKERMWEVRKREGDEILRIVDGQEREELREEEIKQAAEKIEHVWQKAENERFGDDGVEGSFFDELQKRRIRKVIKKHGYAQSERYLLYMAAG